MDDVIKAWNAIDEARLRYQETLRDALATGVPQVEIATALNRTREMIRRDAMTDEEREALRRTDAERKRENRGTKMATTRARMPGPKKRAPRRKPKAADE